MTTLEAITVIEVMAAMETSKAMAIIEAIAAM